MTAPADPYARPYLDADAWIHAVGGTEEGRRVVAPILAAVDEGKLRLVVSAIMPLEVLGGRTDERTRDAEERALGALTRPNVIEVPVGRAVILEARRLRLAHGVDSMDALHLASAVRARADIFSHVR